MKPQLINLHPSLRLPQTKWLRVVKRLLKEPLCSAKLTRIRHLEIVFLDDQEMAKKNWQFKRHRGPTDILTFDYQNGMAELLISLDTTHRNAKWYGCTWQQELTLYLAHGILHLAGFDDQRPKDRQRMREEEKKILSKIRL